MEVLVLAVVVAVIVFGARKLKQRYPSLNKGNDTLGGGGTPYVPNEDEEPRES